MTETHVTRAVVSTQDAPQAIGPYSQAIQAGGVLYCSGQIAIDPQTGQFVDADVQTQTRQVMQNLAKVLEAGGSSFERVVRVTIFVTDMRDFAAVNEVYATFFQKDPPARACVEVSALPKGAKVEIDAIALCL